MRGFIPPEVYPNGYIERRNKKTGKVHNRNGPAIEDGNGNEYWLINDELHRENGPAVILTNGTKKWYQHDKLHRIDGPAVIYPNGEEEYWIEGIQQNESI